MGVAQDQSMLPKSSSTRSLRDKDAWGTSSSRGVRASSRLGGGAVSEDEAVAASALESRCDMEWNVERWCAMQGTYARMVSGLIRFPEIVLSTTHLLGGDELEVVVDVVLRVFSRLDMLPQMLRHLVAAADALHGVEGLEKTSSEALHPVVQELLGRYLRYAGSEYMGDILADMVVQVVQEERLSLEVDPQRILASRELFASFDENGDFEEARTNALKLERIATALMDRMLDAASVESMPPGLSTFLARVLEALRAGRRDEPVPRIARLVLAQLYPCAVEFPHRWMASVPKPRSPGVQRNLHLLALVIRHCILAEDFSPAHEAGSLVALNATVARYAPRWRDFFAALHDSNLSTAGSPLVSDPPALKRMLRECGVELLDLMTIHEFLDNFAEFLVPLLRTSRDVGMRLLAGLDPLPVPPVLRSDGTAPLASGSVYAVEISGSAGPGTPSAHLNPVPEAAREMVDLLLELGPSPISLSRLRAATDPTSFAPISPTQLRASDDESSRSQSTLDDGDVALASLKASGFLYLGARDKSGRAVVYVIIDRLQLDMLSNVNILLEFIDERTAVAVSAPFIVVIDMSWSKLAEAARVAMLACWEEVAGLLGPQYRTNLEAVYVVHPPDWAPAVVHALRAGMARDRRRRARLEMVHHWAELARVIDDVHIQLPDESKTYFGKVFQVRKVNAKGRAQARLIKLTANSLLNIDPRSGVIKNEKLIPGIARLGVFRRTTELRLYFGAEAQPPSPSRASPAQRRSIFARLRTSTTDALVRRYLFASSADRDMALMEVLSRCYYGLATASLCTTFPVTHAADPRPRPGILRVCSDSLLEVDLADRVLRDVSFAGLRGASLAPDDDSAVHLFFKAETFPRVVRCDNSAVAADLRDAILSGLRLFRHDRALHQDLGIDGSGGYNIRRGHESSSEDISQFG